MASSPGSRTVGSIASPPAVSRPCRSLPSYRLSQRLPGCPSRIETSALMSIPGEELHIGSRRHEEIRDLLGDAILGWLVTDGYGADRDYARRQRCLAHLIRKGLALAGGLN